jgi:MFS family permease
MSRLGAGWQVLLWSISANPRERRNVLWLTLATLLNGAGAALSGGELSTGFMKQTGFSMTQLGLIGSAAGLATACGLIAFMGLADRIQQRIRVYVICLLVTVIGPLITVAVALTPRAVFPLPAVLMTFIVSGVALALVTAIPTMLDYPIYARAASPGIRGRLFGITTTAYGLLGIGLGWLSAGVLKELAYPTGYVWCFLAAAAAVLLRAAAFSRIRELPELAVAGASRSPLPFKAIVDVLRLREFQLLAGPHVARGLALSVAGLALFVGLRDLGLPEHYPGYASAMTTAATVLGGVAVTLFADRLGPAWATLFGDAFYALGLGAVMLSPSPLSFLAIYLVLHFGRNIEDNTVPLGAINIVPPEHLGAFSAARLMILIASGAIGAPLFGYVLDHHPRPAAVFALAAAMKALTGVWFWWVFRLRQRAPAPAAAGGSPQPSKG